MEQLPNRLRQAFRKATTGTPGPVHLDLAGVNGYVIAGGEADLEAIIERDFGQVPPFRPTPDPARVQQAIRMLAQAERPIIVAGGGVTASQAGSELVELAGKLCIPVATSLNAKATFPSDHRLALGIPGHYSLPCANQAVCEADLVFFIGSHTGRQVTYEWRIPPADSPIVQLDINLAELGRPYPLVLGLQGDAKASLRAMIEGAEDLAERHPLRTEWFARPGTGRQLAREHRTLVAAACDDGTMGFFDKGVVVGKCAHCGQNRALVHTD